MLGFQLFLHSIRMILGNLGSALRITIPALVWNTLMTVWMISQFGTAFVSGEWASSTPVGQMPDVPDGFWSFLPVAAIGGIITVLWTATAWHRYILLEEHPGALGPRFNGGAIGRYLVSGIILSLAILGAALIIGFVGSLIIAVFAMIGVPLFVGVALTGLLFYAPVVIIFYRISPLLPSAAIGERMSIGQAFDATRGSNITMLVLAIVTIIASFVLILPAGVLTETAPVIAIVFQIILQWIALIFGISIMTTIYGHFVEGRDLNA